MHGTSARAWCTGKTQRDRVEREGGLGWGTHVNPWLIHVNVWQKPLQYCKVISLQLIKINEKRNLPTMKETWIRYLGQEHPLEKGMAMHCSTLAWRISWTESLAAYSPWGHKESDTTEQLTHTHTHTHFVTVIIFPSWGMGILGSIKASRSPLNHQSSLVTFETFPHPRMQGSFKLETQWLLRQVGDLGIFGVAQNFSWGSSHPGYSMHPSALGEHFVHGESPNLQVFHLLTLQGIWGPLDRANVISSVSLGFPKRQGRC